MPGRPAIALLLAAAIASPAAAQHKRTPAPAATAEPGAAPAATPDPDRLAPTRPLPPEPSRWPLAGRDNMELGIGLYSVGGHFVREREYRGREPLTGTAGRQNRVAAVGFSLRF
jgi:hypothetical protein